MILRLVEQLMASGATFITSMVAIRVLDSQSLSLFFLLICGSQIAVVFLAARRISHYLRSPDSLGHLALVGRRATLEVIALSVVVTLAALFLLHRSSNAMQTGWVMAAVWTVFSVTQVGMEWLRRSSAVVFAPALPAASLIAQFIRLLGPLMLLVLGVAPEHAQFIFFCSISASLLMAIGIYRIIFLKARLGDAVSTTAPSSASGATAGIADPRVLLEVFHILAWANVPIAVLAMIGGSPSVARLVAVRTPLSFFNPIIEFIEVHFRGLTENQLRHRGIVLKAVLLTAMWLIGSGLVLQFGDQALALIAGRQILGLKMDMLIFWWLQLLLVIDRLTHNVVRTQGHRLNRIAPTFAIGLALFLLTAALIYTYNVTGCIVSMVVWVTANVMERWHHHQGRAIVNGT
jgi:hypothetical protein